MRSLDLQKLFLNPEREVILGIHGSQHCYLFAGEQRYDGDVLQVPVVREQTGSFPVGEGFFIRIRGLPDRQRSQLRDLVLAKPTSVMMTCVHGACKVLRQSGITVSGQDPIPVFSGPTFGAILNSGILGENGKPIDYEVYLASERSLSEWIQFLTKRDQELTAEVASKFEGLSPAVLDRIASRMDEETRRIFFGLLPGASAPDLLVLPQAAKK